MSLDLTSVGSRSPSKAFEYDWQKVVLYALAVGATRDELDFVYEGRGPKVLPTFAVIAAYPGVYGLFERLKLDLTRLVHASQAVRFMSAIPPEGKLETVATVRGIYDMKKFAQVVITTETHHRGEPCFETEWTLLLRDDGGFDGPRPPKTEVPKIPKDQAASFVHQDQTSPQQALLYRLLGDHNPLHADPEFAKVAGFEQGPILHGLCTFGFAARAVIRHACAGNPARLRSIYAYFRKPVWPGESLRTDGYALNGSTIAFEVFAGDRPDPVLTSGWAEISS